tara:strand:+ start:4456 stop:4572 length:117 start_codon:yes stop_codon:yes gene_type:complete
MKILDLFVNTLAFKELETFFKEASKLEKSGDAWFKFRN